MRRINVKLKDKAVNRITGSSIPERYGESQKMSVKDRSQQTVKNMFAAAEKARAEEAHAD